MQQLDHFLDKYPARAFTILLIIALPAFLINLGLFPLFADEPTRANVALEMILSKNYAVPTIGGEYYYNKPPLYNWILAGFYLITGSYSEFVTRLPAVIPLFLFAITIYISVNYFLRNKKIAVLSGLLMLVNGRMLIYDSMLGHIDIFYSWLTFISFMLIFYFYQRKKWFWLFFFSYTLTAITFLCKGLPSIVFQGLTIISLLIYTKNFKKLFSWQHIVSGLLCLLIIGAYFFNYYQYNPNLKGYLETIWSQSSQRTVANHSGRDTIYYILQFPFEHLMHLFPASMFALFCFNRLFWKTLMANDFLKFITIIFFANIWVYWLSPDTRPRYLIMLYPLLYIVWSHAYYTYRDQLPKLYKAFNWILLSLGILVTMAVLMLMTTDFYTYISAFYYKLVIVFLGCALFTFLIFKLVNNKVLAFAGLLLVVRLGFSWFIIPNRLQTSLEETGSKKAAIEMGTISKDAPFYFYQYHPDVHSIPFHDRLIFYIERTRQRKVKFIETDSKPGYYFTFDRNLKNPKAILLKKYLNGLQLFQVK